MRISRRGWIVSNFPLSRFFPLKAIFPLIPVIFREKRLIYGVLVYMFLREIGNYEGSKKAPLLDNVAPDFVIDDVCNCCLRDIKSFSKFSLGVFSGPVHFSDLRNLLSSKLCFTVALT